MLEIKSENGTIKFSDNLFIKIMREAFLETKGKLGFADQRTFKAEVVGNELNFNAFAVISFGASIKTECDVVINKIGEKLKEIFPDFKINVYLNIVGVRSKKVAPRDIVVQKTF